MQHARDQLPTLAVVESKTREQAAYEVIRGNIIAGRWRPGAALAISHLARDLGISRIPVTNAVKRLASEGFLQVRPHLEAVVAPLDVAVVREVYLMRAALEALALGEAATRATPADIMAMRARNNELRLAASAPTTTVAHLRTLDRSFHRQIWQVTGMPYLIQTLENLADQCEYYRACLLDQQQLSVPLPERHEVLITALEDRSTTVTSLGAEHILAGMTLIIAALERTA